MLLMLAMLACTCPECGDTECPGDTEDTEAPADPCDLVIAPQPDEDVLGLFPPVVVWTCPRPNDQNVDPTLDTIQVQFSKQMADGSWSWVTIGEATTPELDNVRYVDPWTNVADVVLEPDHTYALWFNLNPYVSFVDTNHNSAVPYMLTFHTAPE